MSNLNLGINLNQAVPEAIDMNSVIEAVCERIPPFWPLDAMVATNPYLGYVQHPFEQAAEYQLRILGRRMTAERAWFRQQFEAGRITRADLQQALDENTSGITVDEVVAALHEPEPAACAPLLYSSLLDERYRPAQSRYVVQQISQFCAAWYDQGQALWRMPRFADSLYGAWRAYLRIDRSPGWMEISDVETPLAAVPETAREAIPVVLRQLGVPADKQEDFLTVALASIGGWASYLRARRWEAELDGGGDEDLVDLLAIRLTWELILLSNDDRPERVAQWRQSLCCWPERLGAEQRQVLESDLLWQRALEIGYQRQLAAGLAVTPAPADEQQTARPLALAAFCIDVRSEVFRRALETADGAIRTQGFAGFFGVMARFRPLGAQRARKHLPVLLPARYEVCETAGDGGGQATAALDTRRRLALGLGKAWKQFKLSASSCFSFVETAGLLLYAPKLISDSLAWTTPVTQPETAGLSAADQARLRPDLDAQGDGATGIPAEARPEAAAFILNAMGLQAPFPRLVLLAGHGSSTVNNPQRAGLDCGACAGQTGAASVRMAATLLNEAGVRAALRSQGTDIPDDTWFVPAVHDTTTDAVTVLDRDQVPASLVADLARLERALQQAGTLTRSERLSRLLPQVPATDAERQQAVEQRSRDWSQVRPEWGLAGNAAFIAAPRTRTAHLSLEGRAFLHEYDWTRDQDFQVLKLIMTAPMVVANWINLQYYGSVVDPEHLGAGNKVLHNVVGGRLGVLEGNGGDLRIGLALQSLHDGRDWVHEPLRLSVFIEAPQAAMEQVLADNPNVAALVDNGWLYLFRIDPEQGVFRRSRGGEWLPAA
ncbi:UPF0753 protein [Thiohalobacter sp. COW1]|uniref:YbcC family protein n=1 Tax=Thiohalobacter sp. COW1 TaxID=2795687 RepID=UPI0019156AAF|nr:DUF2309 domain-containing protein [Thiohalobacter sp. COW1]BCO30153.1 UPF0753 protein [Thiohalobacter sp. COW1]